MSSYHLAKFIPYLDFMSHMWIVNYDICQVTLLCKRVYIYIYLWVYIMVAISIYTFIRYTQKHVAVLRRDTYLVDHNRLCPISASGNTIYI